MESWTFDRPHRGQTLAVPIKQLPPGRAHLLVVTRSDAFAEFRVCLTPLRYVGSETRGANDDVLCIAFGQNGGRVVSCGF